MTEQVILFHRLGLVLCGAIFVSGLATIFLRRVATWILVGQLVSLKAVSACAFFLSKLSLAAREDFIVLSLVSMGMVPIVAAVGLLVLHRCKRFEGSLDVDEETVLRN